MAETLFRQWFVEEAEEDWENTTLEDQTDVFRGLSYTGSGLTEKGLGIPMHNLNSVYEGGGYKYEGIKYYKGEYKDRHLIYPCEIIVTATEQGHDFKLIGCPAIIPTLFGDKGLFSQDVFKIKVKESSRLTNEYLYYLIGSSKVREQIIAASNGSSINHPSIEGLKKPSFNVPQKERILEFTEIVKNYWLKKDKNHLQIHILKALRDNLLPKLMSGEVRVKID
jgi:type I restriction enzyme S subunit